jgi:CheY-like chemotaxis protein
MTVNTTIDFSVTQVRWLAEKKENTEERTEENKRDEENKREEKKKMGGIVSSLQKKQPRNKSSLAKVNERDLQEYYESEIEETHLEKYARALVVDDSRFNRKMLSRTIADFFVEVVQAEDGLEAIKHVENSIAAKKPFDIIFMDSIMPNMGGIDATARIRELGYTSLIIGVTGDITEEDAEKFVRCGVNDVMLKPLLLPHVESILIGC